MQIDPIPALPHGPMAAAAVFLTALLAASTPVSAADGALARRPSPPGAVVYIISPAAGDSVTSPVTIRFGLHGMGVAPAGVEKPNTGHHHLLIDTVPPDMSLPVPADDTHRHYGGGQTEATLELSPGRHSLQLLLADERHIPHDPPVISEKIEIVVE
ncbi:MAG: DUF4399 domain-containing protein [Myxococcota bacterium]